MQNRSVLITSLLLVVLVVVSIFGYMQYEKKQNYERYLSLRLSNNLSYMTSGIILANDLLIEIIESKKINYTQFVRLNDRIQWIGSNGDEMIDLSDLVKPDQITSNEVVGASNGIRYYLDRQFKDEFTEKTNVVSLKEGELFTLGNFQKLTGLWAAELEKHIEIIHIPESKYLQGGIFLNDVFPFNSSEFTDYYTKNGINREDWQELMYGIERICNENKDYYKHPRKY